ncbi:MAG: hypothetical protein P4L83_11495 [Nevskia sp.]|nr:hypothetical protein [Nevskia sp.]
MRSYASWVAILALALSACGSGQDSGGSGTSEALSPAAAGTNPHDAVSDAAAQAYFNANVEPNVQSGNCRVCHMAGGLANQSGYAIANQLTLSSDATQDYANFLAAWQHLPQPADVTQNDLLVYPAGGQGHPGGSVWTVGGTAYSAMESVLNSWAADSGSSSSSSSSSSGGATGSSGSSSGGGSGSGSSSSGSGSSGSSSGTTSGGSSGGSSSGGSYPLLGDLNATGGRNYAAAFCQNQPDSAALPPDPRKLISGSNINNASYAVYFNAPFQEPDWNMVIQNQAKQNAILVSQGKQPVYTAKLRPSTCGQWRASVDAGRKYIFSNPITGDLIPGAGLYNVAKYLGYTVPADPAAATALLQQVVGTRYGYPPSPYPNPFPMPGEDPNATNGGSVQLPLGLVQTKDASGKWTGNIGATCFACHLGQIGSGEVTSAGAADYEAAGHPEITGANPNGFYAGSPGTNVDVGLLYYDADQANGVYGKDSIEVILDFPGYMASRSRGVNAADQEIVNVLLFRDLKTLDWISPALEPSVLGKLVPTIPLTGGDQQTPSWWWTHNKSRYLWIGLNSSGFARNDFFPSSTTKNDGDWIKHREGDYEDLDTWLNAVEAPAYPYGYCSNADGGPGPNDNPACINKPLAEQGAILFHSLNLWTASTVVNGKTITNAAIPKPQGGNGSCAGCHGAYSPQFANQPGFLPDPSLIGMSGYVVPGNIIGTDPADGAFLSGAPTFVAGVAKAVEPYNPFGNLWMEYPDASSEYVIPESQPKRNLLSAVLDDDLGPGPPPGTGQPPIVSYEAMGGFGYTAQPLHGVWAAAPYFHNGSVPTVWDVLKPSDRPMVWRRQLAATANARGERGYDTTLNGYDFANLGWKYDKLGCNALVDSARILCAANPQDVPTIADLLLKPLKVLADYFQSPGLDGPNAVADREVYDATGYSHANQGHQFTQVLTDQERKALVEYLKTL